MAQSDNVIRLVTSKDRVVRACSTCKHRYKDWNYRCGAVEMSCSSARTFECSEGKLWEPIELKPPVVVRIRKWLFGW